MNTEEIASHLKSQGILTKISEDRVEVLAIGDVGVFGWRVQNRNSKPILISKVSFVPVEKGVKVEITGSDADTKEEFLESVVFSKEQVLSDLAEVMNFIVPGVGDKLLRS